MIDASTCGLPVFGSPEWGLGIVAPSNTVCTSPCTFGDVYTGGGEATTKLIDASSPKNYSVLGGAGAAVQSVQDTAAAAVDAVKKSLPSVTSLFLIGLGVMLLAIFVYAFGKSR